MRRVKNPALPTHLRNIKTALNWAIQNGLKYEEFFPAEVENYTGLIEFSNQSMDDGEDDYAKLEQVWEVRRILGNAEEYIDRMLDYEDLDEVELYREITIKKREDIRWDGIGIYWAYDESCANAHWGDGGRPTMLTGLVFLENIDWEGGFLAYCVFGNDECEVRVDKGAPIQIIAIDGEELEEPIEATA